MVEIFRKTQERQPAKRTLRYGICFCLLVLCLAALLLANLMIGSVMIPPQTVWSVLKSHGQAGSQMAGEIIWEIRLPRIAGAVMLGGGLAAAGFVLQTFFSNPIAGPFVLGISSGSKLAVAAAMILALEEGRILHSVHLVAAAFAGALITTGLILSVSGKVRSLSVLILCGVMIGYICSAVTELLITFADDSNIVNLHHWSMGSFSGIGWEQVRVITPLMIFSFLWAMLLTKPMGAYQMGEVYAANMGVKVRRFRVGMIGLSSLLSACVTAFAGPVSFVGIAVPHLVRKLFGTAKPLVVLPACFLGGASFCLFCDLLARTVFAPTELSISTVTAVFGAPVVTGMLLGGRRTE